MTVGIYQIWIGDKFYIGRSKNMEHRVAQHSSQLKQGKHGNIIMQNAYNKYQMFEWYPLVECATEACIAWEQAYIDDNIQDHECMNIRTDAKHGGWSHTVGKGYNKGRKASIETRLKMSKSRLGNTNCVGNTLSDEHKKKLSKANRGRKLNKLNGKFEVIL